MSTKDIKQKAHALISGKISRNEVVQMTWAVNELITMEGTITGDGSGFYTLCAKEHVYRVVKACVDKYSKGHDVQEQMTMEGFEYLQKAYTAERNSERQLIPIDMLTDRELEDRELEFMKQAGGLQKHAKELNRYRLRRNLAKATTA